MPVAAGTIIKPQAGRASDALIYEYMQGRVPAFARAFDATVIADAQNSWVLVKTRSRTIFSLFVDAGGTFSGRFQASYDKDGLNFYDVIPEAGSTTTANPITQASVPGIWIFSGPYYYLRFNPTAVGVAAMHADVAVMAL